MKKLLKIVLSVFMAMALAIQLPVNLVSIVNAEEVNSSVVSDFEYYLNDDGEIVITGYNGSETDITIPSKIEGYNVVEIGERAFEYSDLTSVTIENGITTIGKMAFYACDNLTSVTLPSGLTTISDGAFADTGLTSVTIPDSVTTLGKEVFLECYSLTSVVIGSGVTTIGNSTFFECFNLTSVNIPEGVTSIGSYAFYLCHSLTSLTIPSSVTTIGDYAFFGCNSLVSLTIPSSVEEIGEDAFADLVVLYVYDNSYASQYAIDNNYNYVTIEDTSLDETYAQDDDIIVEDHGLYYSIYTILSEEDKTVELTSYYNTESGDYVGGLTESVVLSSTVEEYTVVSIADGAFDLCGDIQEITIPACITNIEDGAFSMYFHPQVFYVYSGSAALQYVIDNNFNYVIIDADSDNEENTYDQSTIYTSEDGNYMYTILDDGTIEIYIYNGDEANVVIPSTIDGYTVTSIDEYAFEYCSTLVSVVIPNTVTTIEHAAFFGCENLTSVTIPNSVTYIGGYAFAYCTKLTSITIPSSVTSIGEYAFVSDIQVDDYENIESVTYIITIYAVEGSYAAKYASDNGITLEYITDEEDDSTSTVSSVQTGDESQLVAYVLLGGIALVGAYYTRKRKYN
ncbi:MAG: leucine-rich repeat domain-containing protein [Erysipelotrichaceae bacterium]|nr:leucine-rich repeat domain-containing protein [Erysipelotrichaceae bacterium]